MQIQFKSLWLIWFGFLTMSSLAIGAEPDDVNFKELVEIANRFDLPRPNANAKLVVGFMNSWHPGVGPNGTDAGIYRPGFVIENSADQSVNVMVGFNEMDCSSTQGDPSTRPFTMATPDEKRDGYSIEFRHLSCFETAVQFAMLGKEDEAKKLWSKFAESKYITGSDSFGSVAEHRNTPSVLLALCIFIHLEKISLLPNADLGEIANRASDLRSEFPVLFSKDPKDYTRNLRNQFVDDLKLTADSAVPAGDSIEGLLIRWGNMQSEMRHLGFFSSHNLVDDAPAREIFYRGAEAIEDLVKLVDDRRLSVHVRPRFNNAPPYRYRIGDLAKMLLCNMTGARGPKSCSRGWGYGETKDWKEWALDNKLDDDEAFFLTAAFKDETGESFEVPVRILAARHPEKFQTFCKSVGKKATAATYCHYITFAIRDSKIESAKKNQLLTLLAKQLPDNQKRWAVQALGAIDDSSAAKLILPMILKIPHDVDGPYWTSETASLTHAVMQIDDVEVWRSYLTAAKKASVGLRMEMMEPMNYSYITGKQKQHRLAFLAAFLDDSTVRVMSGNKFEGPCAAFTIEKISVRNFAAMKLASLLLEGQTQAKENWNEEKWELLRTQVREQLAEQDLPDFQ